MKYLFLIFCFTASADPMPLQLQKAQVVAEVAPGGGRVSGFRFIAVEEDSVYARVGLRPMDVLTDIDNRPINSPTEAMEMYNRLRKGEYSELGIFRGGKRLVLKWRKPN